MQQAADKFTSGVLVETAESTEFILDEYYWTEPVQRALLRLENAKGVLLGIIGLQGTGKSSALRAIEEKLSVDGFKCVRYKWPKDYKEQAAEDITNNPSYNLALWNTLLEKHPEKIDNVLKESSETIARLVKQVKRLTASFTLKKMKLNVRVC